MTSKTTDIEDRLGIIRKARQQALIDAGKALDALRRAAGEHGEVAAKAAIRALAALRGVDADPHQQQSEADGELLTHRWGDNFAAAVEQALGRRDKQITDAVARIDALEVSPPRTPEDEAGIEMGVDCVQRLMDARGEGETIAQVLDRLLILWGSSKDVAMTKTHGARKQALVVTYSDSPDGPLSMFVDLEGEDGAALDPLAFTDAGRALVVGLEAIAAKTEEAS